MILKKPLKKIKKIIIVKITGKGGQSEPPRAD